jgi:alpha-beta hydrolase superfamily lysophospholipase
VPKPEQIHFHSLGDKLAAALFVPADGHPSPALILCHGAGEFKENYFELADFLAARGVAALAVDMHGHGASGGDRFFIKMEEWVPDISAAVDYLITRPEIDGARIGAFGLSSGGTAVLEAAILDSRLKSLVALDATVRNSLPFGLTAFLKVMVWIGAFKKNVTGKDWRVPLAKLSKANLASDPEIQQKLLADPRALEAFMAFPFPSGSEAFFVDTIERAAKIRVPTRIIWGEDDHLDPPETARLLYGRMTCTRELHIVAGNGHVGHLDRNKAKVFELTLDWARRMTAEPAVNGQSKLPRTIEGDAARAMGMKEKWELLSPILTRHGRESLAYPTLQSGLEYFMDEHGYIAYLTVQHPVFARQPKPIVFSDPVCAVEDYPAMLTNFLAVHPRAVFGCISEACATVLRGMKFKVNCLGYEIELPVQTYNTAGNWKDLDMIKRARNEAKREKIVIREETIENVNQAELAELSKKWLGGKKVSEREIWLYARRPVMTAEPGVRKFVAYDRDGHVAGFAFYDPMYRDGKVFGYAANILRCDEQRFGRLITAIHMEAVDKFKPEGVETLNLCLAPFVGLDRGKYNDDHGVRAFLDLSAKYGNTIYNFEGLAFHKSKYRGSENFLYLASRSAMPTNDLYLAFRSAGITESYFETVGRLLQGIMAARKAKKPAPTATPASPAAPVPAPAPTRTPNSNP